MISRKSEKRFSRKQIQAEEVINPPSRLSFLGRFTQRFPAKVGGAAISALIVLHFVSQFIFFQSDSVQNEIAPPKIENKQIVETKPNYEPVKPNLVTAPKKLRFAPPVVVQPERKEAAAPMPKAIKKKQPRESKAERLRRAEKLLTGV